MQVLHTRLSRLEPLRVEHAAEMFPLLSDPRIYEHLTDKAPATVAELAERYRRLEAGRSPDNSQRWLNWIIRPINGGACAGFIQATLYTPLTGDFAFILGPAFWGRGLACDAATAALHLLFTDHAIRSVFATTGHRNLRSIALLTRLGFHEIAPAEYPHDTLPESDRVFQLNYDDGAFPDPLSFAGLPLHF